MQQMWQCRLYTCLVGVWQSSLMTKSSFHWTFSAHAGLRLVLMVSCCVAGNRSPRPSRGLDQCPEICEVTHCCSLSDRSAGTLAMLA